MPSVVLARERREPYCPSMQLERITLDGEFVCLEPLDRRHFEPLLEAALANPTVFAHIPYRMTERADFEKVFALAERMHAAEAAIVFATCVGAERTPIGSTSIRCVDPATPSVEIGGTWIAPAWQRTRVNTEAKLLQLAHCFEVLGTARVEFKTDARNARSRAAIARLGATEEGTLRAHMRRHDGTLRDSVYFSMVSGEWPAVKARLLERLRAGQHEAKGANGAGSGLAQRTGT